MTEVQKRFPCREAAPMPCSSCPFRIDITFYLSTEKVESILDALLGDDGFTCHNTIAVTGKPSGHAKVCLGAAIFLEHVRAGGLRVNLAFRLREVVLQEFHRDELNVDAAVFTDVASFTRAKQVPC